MGTQNANSIVLPKSAIREKEGIVILPLKMWKKIEDALEDLEMYQSEGLVKEIAKRREETAVVPLKKLLKKYYL